MLLCLLGVSWAVYIRMWQIVLWEDFSEAIQQSLDQGYTLSSKWWKVEVSCSNQDGDVRSWKGGVFAQVPLSSSDLSADEEMSSVFGSGH
jgi:hypothetical protein